MTIINSNKFQKVVPYLALTTGIVALSISAMFIRWANAPGPVTGFYRQFFAFIIMAPFMLKKLPPCRKLFSTNFIFPVLGGIASGCDLGLWSSALSFTTASNATVIGNTAPLWVALVGLFFLRQRLKRAFWIGMGFTIGGIFLTMGSDFFLHPRLGIGDLMALGTSCFFAGYYLATEQGRKYFDPLTYTWTMTGFAAFTLLVINLVLQNELFAYPASTWLVFLGAAIVSQLIGYTALSYSLGHIPASIVSPTMLGQPVLTTIFAIPLLNEIPTIYHVLGGGITILGIYLVNRSHIGENSG